MPSVESDVTVLAPGPTPLEESLHKIPYCEMSVQMMEHSDPVHSTPEEFENGGFTLRTHQMFSVLTTTEKFENATIVHHVGFVFEQNSVKYHMIIVSFSFSKSSLIKCFQIPSG